MVLTQSFFILLYLFSCKAITDNLKLCTNDSRSCTGRFLPNTSASESDCMLVVYRGSNCSSKQFVTSSSPYSLGKMRLRVYPFENNSLYVAFNLSLTDIKWTEFWFRFKQLGGDLTFCRKYYRSSAYYIKEMFYDCLSTPAVEAPGQSFEFEYQAEDEHNDVEVRRFVLKIPFFWHIEMNAPLQNYTPFLYVDITDSPVLTARWQQPHFHDLKYKVEFYKTQKGSGGTLEHSAEVIGDDSKGELSYTYNIFPSSGIFYVKVVILSSKCIDGVCSESTSPEVHIDDAFSKTMLVGVVGCVVLLPLFLFIIFMWRRQCQPPSVDVKLPVVLMIHTPSRASHLKSVIALAEYLKKHCLIETLLDQLNIQSSQNKDPWAWCNDAFARADFVMVVSSPPKCCNEEGIFRNMDLVALRFLKEKFSSGSSRPRFFSVLLPYCTKSDIPEEAKHLRVFKLLRDFDLMLWYIHNGGKLPSILNSAQMLIGPRPHGGKSELNIKGNALLTALKEAEFDREKLCDCVMKKAKESDNDDDESTGFIKSASPIKDSENGSHLRNVSETGSTFFLLRKSESCEISNDFEETNIEFVDSRSIFPHVTDLDLLQENDTPAVLTVGMAEDAAKTSGFNIHALKL